MKLNRAIRGLTLCAGLIQTAACYGQNETARTREEIGEYVQKFLEEREKTKDKNGCYRGSHLEKRKLRPDGPEVAACIADEYTVERLRATCHLATGRLLCIHKFGGAHWCCNCGPNDEHE